MRRLVVCFASLLLLAFGSPIATAAQSATPVAGGGAAQGQHLLEFVAKISQNGPDFTLRGYVIHAAGVDDAALFTDGNAAARSEKTARFTIFGTARTVSLAEVEDRLYSVDATGILTFYLNDKGGADFDTNKGFDAGTVVATSAARFQNVITVMSAKQGLANGTGDLTVQSATPVTLGGATYPVGQPGTSWRLSFNGLGTLQRPLPPVATIFVAGSAVGQ
jgi:hypothetical protein